MYFGVKRKEKFGLGKMHFCFKDNYYDYTLYNALRHENAHSYGINFEQPRLYNCDKIL